MARKDKGFIKLYRSVLDNEIWRSDEPFDRRSAWVDLLLLAQHSEYKGTTRGSFRTNISWLARRWGWSRNKVRRFIGHLTDQGCVTTNGSRSGTSKGTTITLVNYEKFQGERPSNEPSDEPSKRPSKRPSNGSYNKNVYTSNDSTMNGETTVDPASLWDPQGRVYE